MLSIGVMSGGQGHYYQMLAREDYYLNGGEPPGRWWGATRELNLPEVITSESLRNLFDGRGMDGTDLVQNAGSKSRRPGFDFTFNAPKSVSVLWAVAPGDMRREIQAAQDQAVRRTLSYAEDTAAFCRTGKGGSEIHRARLVAGLFEHSTSRAMDAHLHTHALIMNVGVMEDGRTRALVAPRLFEQKMTLGALYRAELAAQLEQRLGLVIERDRFSFKVAGVSEAACEDQSKRRAEIEKELGAKGLESAEAAAIAAKESREVKSVVPPRSELFRKWQSELGDQFSFTQEQAAALRGQAFWKGVSAQDAALDEALGSLTADRSHFTTRDLTRSLAESSQGHGLDIDRITEIVAQITEGARLATEGEKLEMTLYGLGRDLHGEDHFTTPQVHQIESEQLKLAEHLNLQTGHGVAEGKVRTVLDHYSGHRTAAVDEIKHHTAQILKAARKKQTEKIDREEIRRDTNLKLSVEQRQAVRYLTLKGNGGIRSLEGAAGTGKTSTLRAARAAWEKGGYEVIGATISGKARKELERGSGIRSFTLASLNIAMDRGFEALGKHHLKQLNNLVNGKKVHDFKPFAFTSKHVLVIDEAGMVDTPSLMKLMKAVGRAGGMVVLAFDRNQIQAIGRGGAAAAIADRFGKAELNKIIRQRDARDVQVVRDMAHGNAGQALASLAERGYVALEPTRDKAIARLISDWSRTEKGRPNESLIFAASNADVQDLNRRCQAARLETGEISGPVMRVTATIGEEKVPQNLHQGDRVMFLANSRAIGVNNGEFGTILRIGTNPRFPTLTVRLDDGKKVVVPLSDYQQIALGYACTTHKGQGTTVDRAYILAGGKMQDRQLSHVQVSRARESTRIYADAREAGHDFEQLARRMGRSTEKTLALIQQVNLLRPT